MQLVVNEVSTPLHIKFSDANKIFADKEKLSLVELFEKLGDEYGLDMLDRVITARQMVDNGQITEEEGSAVLNFYLRKNEDEFFQYQRQLQEAYQLPAMEQESKIRSVLAEEAKALEREGNVLPTEPELRGRRKTTGRNNKPIKNKESEQ